MEKAGADSALVAGGTPASASPEEAQYKPKQWHYPFLLADQDEKLSILLCNYLSLGQFELARATLHQLAALNPQKALNILKELILNGPPSDW